MQEHFILSSSDKKHSNTDKIRRAFGEKYDMFIVPAVKSNDKVTRGRGKGGLCTMWKKGLTKYVSKVECNNFRVQATKFQFSSSNLLVINSYFMCDSGNNFDDNELHALLAEIRRVIEVSECQNISLMGDLNCDFSRQTPFVQIVRNFCESLSIQPIWSHPRHDTQCRIVPVSHTYCQIVNNVARHSCVDHFVLNQRLYDAIAEAGSIQSVDNFSGHDPIYCKIRFEQLDLKLEKVEFKSVPSWGKANNLEKDNYQNELDRKLNNIAIPACIETCRDLQCKEHVSEINNYCEDILEAVEVSANENLPKTRPPRSEENSKIMPGWNEYVKPFKEEAQFWKSVWVSAGKPNDHPLFHNMKSSKGQYKYAIRRLKCQQIKFRITSL